MIYADYLFYREYYHGKLSEDSFSRFSIPASAYLERVTFGRAKTYLDSEDLLKLACCAVTDCYSQEESGVVLTSEHTDGYDATYAASASTPEQRRYAAARLYLPPELLYCGLGRCGHARF